MPLYRLLVLGLLLTACPTTTTCPDGQVWYPDMARCAPADGGVDAPVLDGGSDAGPCGVCDTATPFCNTTSMMCVECLEATDCTGAGDAACVAGSCVACDTNDDCRAETPQCSATNTCEACTDATACTGRPEGEICGASGACVECSADDETACGTNVCDVEAGTCTDIAMGSAVVCEPCVSDRQCPTGQLCVPTTFPVLGGTEVGNRCLWRLDAAEGPMGDCTRIAVRPYVRALSATSVSGVSTMVCSPRVSTCDALGDFQSGAITCTASGATPDPMCGAEGFDDGFCSGGRCTVECTTNDDCPCTGITCARQYRCRMGACEFDCECPTSGGACAGTCP